MAAPGTAAVTGAAVTGAAVADSSQPGLDVAARVLQGTFTLDVELAVGAGEVLCVLGPNGAGKTTLLRALAGLAALSEGQIRLGGEVLDEPAAGVFVAPERRPVGLVFQEYRLFPHLSVLDNVAFAARSRGRSRRQAQEVALPWLGRLGLADLADRRPGRLSGGQSQRVALARALAAEPSLLLMDEPLAALDSRTRLAVRGELRDHLSLFTGPILLVTHDPLEAMVMADRLLVLEGGRAVQQGSPAEVARRPATDYVARLMGLNLYAGRVGEDAALVHLDGGGRLAVLPQAERGEVLVAVRPSAISVSTERPAHASPRNVWRGTVVGLELLVDRVRVSVRGQPDALVDVTPSSVAELGLAAGSEVWLSTKATETEVYSPPASGSGPLA